MSNPINYPWPELQPPALHGVLGDYWNVISPHTEADPAAILFQGLAAIGNLIGRSPHFVAERSSHHLNIFTTIVGRTAKGRKGSSWSQVQALTREIDGAWQCNRIMSGLSSGEGLIYAVRDAVPGKPGPKGQNHAEDTGADDKRLLVVEAEFASVLKLVEREGNSLSPVVRLAWETGNLQSMTKNSPLKATDAHISIIGHISKDELVRRLSATEIANGFANRFLWVCVERSKLLPDGGDLDPRALAPIVKRISEAVDFARRTGIMKRDSGARDLWHQSYADLSDGGYGMLGATTSRAEAQTMRLACIYALLDLSNEVRREHLQAALAAWHYVYDSCRFIFGDAMGDPVADEIARALASAPNGMTRTQINKHFLQHRSSTEIARAIGVIVERGLGHSIVVPGAGRSTELWMPGQAPANQA